MLRPTKGYNLTTPSILMVINQSGDICFESFCDYLVSKGKEALIKDGLMMCEDDDPIVEASLWLYPDRFCYKPHERALIEMLYLIGQLIETRRKLDKAENNKKSLLRTIENQTSGIISAALEASGFSDNDDDIMQKKYDEVLEVCEEAKYKKIGQVDGGSKSPWDDFQDAFVNFIIKELAKERTPNKSEIHRRISKEYKNNPSTFGFDLPKKPPSYNTVSKWLNMAKKFSIASS